MTVALEPSATLTFRIGALLVRGAGALVPVGKRSDWRREWEAELWHAVFACRRSGAPSMAEEGGLVLRCLGAYQHAVWLRARQLRRRRLRVRITASVGALRADPRPAALALAAVALTVGTAAVLFGVAGQSARRVLPSPQGERIVRLFNSAPAAELDRTGLSGFELARFAARSRTVERLAAFRMLPPSSGPAAARIAPEFLPLLQVTPSSGRGFAPLDYRPGATPVALAREDAGLLPGATVLVGGIRHTVVGVVPNDLRFPRPDTRLWLPLTVDSGLAALGERNTGVIGRLRPGVTADRAGLELTTLSRQLQAEHPEGYLGVFGVPWSVLVEPAGAAPRDASTLAGILLIGAVLLGLAGSGAAAGFVGRRTALAWVLPVGAGGCMGWVAATLTLRWIGADGARSDPPGVATFVLAATAAALVTSLVFGLSGRRRALAGRRGVLVAICMVVSVVCLATAIAAAQSYRRLAGERPGLDPAGLVALLPAEGATLDSLALRRAAALSGVAAVSTSSQVPLLYSGPTATFEIEGALGRGPAPSAALQRVGAGYFATARIPLLAGRSFVRTEDPVSPAEVVVNRTLAARFFRGEAMGRRLVVHLGPGRPSGWMTVVGVVGDVRRSGTDRHGVAELYLPPDPREPVAALLLRLTGPPAATVAELHALGRPLLLDGVIRSARAPLRLAALLLALAALVAGAATLVCCFAAARATLWRAAIGGAAIGAGVVALGAPALARLPSGSAGSGYGLALAAAGASLLLALPAALSRRHPGAGGGSAPMVR